MRSRTPGRGLAAGWVLAGLVAGLSATAAEARSRCVGPAWMAEPGTERLVYHGPSVETYRLCVRPGEQGRAVAKADGQMVPLPQSRQDWSCADVAARDLQVMAERGGASGTYCRVSGMDQLAIDPARPHRPVGSTRARVQARKPAAAPCFLFGGQRYCE